MISSFCCLRLIPCPFIDSFEMGAIISHELHVCTQKFGFAKWTVNIHTVQSCQNASNTLQNCTCFTFLIQISDSRKKYYYNIITAYQTNETKSDKS